MAKICTNCACYKVCFMANPYRTKDCNMCWQPFIVKCKDCKDYHKNTCPLRAWAYTKPDDFCSYGERKDNERKAD